MHLGHDHSLKFFPLSFVFLILVLLDSGHYYILVPYQVILK